jgi:hypothetical protein
MTPEGSIHALAGFGARSVVLLGQDHAFTGLLQQTVLPGVAPAGQGG